MIGVCFSKAAKELTHEHVRTLALALSALLGGSAASCSVWTSSNVVEEQWPGGIMASQLKWQ